MSIVRSEFESSLKLKSLICLTSRTNRIDGEEISEELTMQITPKVDFTDSNGVVELGIKVFSENNVFEAEVIMQGEFELSNCPKGTDIYDKVTKQNTVAIIFPYVRSQMSLITSQPGLSPVIIPTINVSTLMVERKSADAQAD